MSRQPSWRTEFGIVGGILVIVAIAGGLAIARSGPLGYDEAVYASRARSIVTDIPASSWAIHRPPVLPIVGIAAAPFGFSDASLRIVTLGLGILSLIAVWALARRLWGPWPGILALLAVLACPVVLVELRTFHNDLPAVGLLALLMLLLWDQFEGRDQPGPMLLAAGPIAAATFYLRFGSVVAIGAIALAAIVLWGPRVVRHGRLVGATVGIAAILALPHLASAVEATGSPFGILQLSASLVESPSELGTLVDYVRWLPLELAGASLALILVGLADLARELVRSTRRRRLTAAARREVWLLLPAAITAAGLVLVSHAEHRYVLLPLLIAVVAGAGPAVRILRSVAARATEGRAWAVSWAGAVALVMGAAVIATAVAFRQLVAIDATADQRQWIEDAGRAIAADAGGQCVVLTTIRPQIGWYSTCEALAFTRERDDAIVGDDSRIAYVVLTAIDDERVDPDVIEPYRALLESRPVAVIPLGVEVPDAEVYRLRP